MDIIKTLLSQINLTLIITIIFSFFTLKTSNIANKKDLAQDRYEKVYYHLFSCIEPHLYHPYSFISQSDLQNIITTFQYYIKTYPSLIDPQIKFYFQEFIFTLNNPLSISLDTQQYFEKLCKTIDKEYDSICKYIGIPTRNREYRIKHKQYKNKWTLFQILILLFTESFTKYIWSILFIIIFFEIILITLFGTIYIII